MAPSCCLLPGCCYTFADVYLSFLPAFASFQLSRVFSWPILPLCSGKIPVRFASATDLGCNNINSLLTSELNMHLQENHHRKEGLLGVKGWWEFSWSNEKLVVARRWQIISVTNHCNLQAGQRMLMNGDHFPDFITHETQWIMNTPCSGLSGRFAG